MKKTKLFTPIPKRGFTFFEVMVTVAIIAFGITFIYQSFFMSLNYINHLTYRLYGNILLDNKVNEFQENYYLTGSSDNLNAGETKKVTIYNRPLEYTFGVEFRDVAQLKDILFVHLNIFWDEGNKRIQLSRQAYLLKN